MSDTFGRNLTITIFGESHGEAVGAVIDGMPAGVRIDEDRIRMMLERRRSLPQISTSRRETDLPQFLSGVKDGFSEGTPLTMVLPNRNHRRSDYEVLKNTPRPSHADYTGMIHYGGFNDASGGGHFSGRLTAPLTAAGAVCMGMLESRGITLGTHILRMHDISDRAFGSEDDLKRMNTAAFPVLDETAAEAMKQLIVKTREEGDSVGGILETCIMGMPAGIGDPFFDSLESVLAHGMFSIPAVKGIEFGSGFAFADMKGSQANDPYAYKDGRVITVTNHNGGINGGIANGMPIVFRTVVKPTPSIAKKQRTVDLSSGTDTVIEIRGRHDPAIVHRAAPVTDAVTAAVLCDFLIGTYGRNWFGGGK